MSDSSEAASKQLTFEEVAKFNERKDHLQAQHRAYLEQHPELKSLVSDFMGAVLLQKPDDVFAFASRHFGMSRSTAEPPRAVLLSGPAGTGRQTLIETFVKSNSVKGVFVAAKGGKEGGEFGVDNTGDLLRETAAAKEAGKVLVASVSTDLVKELKKGAVVEGSLLPYFVFVNPPSASELRRRLEEAHEHSEDEIEALMLKAKDILKYGKDEGNFHQTVVNDDVDTCAAELKDMLATEFTTEMRKAQKK